MSLSKNVQGKELTPTIKTDRSEENKLRPPKPQPIKKGELFSADNITAKRPGVGISPMRWDEVLGQVAQKDYEKDGLI
jgi:sialic acid synthase SpsE